MYDTCNYKIEYDYIIYFCCLLSDKTKSRRTCQFIPGTKRDGDAITEEVSGETRISSRGVSFGHQTVQMD